MDARPAIARDRPLNLTSDAVDFSVRFGAILGATAADEGEE
jgi:hypothetical protein